MVTVGRVIPSITQLEFLIDGLEIKKQHVSAYHWPSSGLILINAVRVLHNYCKRAMVLGLGMYNTLTALFKMRPDDGQ